MNRNPYSPPVARVADAAGGDEARTLQVEWPAWWLWTRRCALFFAIVGMTSGILLAVAPFYFGTPTGAPASFIMPGVIGLLVVATHRLNFKRLRDPYAWYSRSKLLTFNLLLLAFFVLGFVEEYRFGEGFRHSPVMMAVFLLLGILPFAVSALFLSLPWAKTTAQRLVSGER
jgi:hypothetical protein